MESSDHFTRLWVTPGREPVNSPGELADGGLARRLEEFGARGAPLELDRLPDGLPGGDGWVVAPPGIEPARLGRLLAGLADAEGAWGCLLLLEGEGAFSLSPGVRLGDEELRARLAEGGARAAALGKRATMAELARIRHDVNNALTSALAEAQFMRMDAPPEGELAEGLALVEGQLQRVRALVAELAAFRMPGG